MKAMTLVRPGKPLRLGETPIPDRNGDVEAPPLLCAGLIGYRSETVPYPLDQANAALDDLRHGRFQGAAELVP